MARMSMRIGGMRFSGGLFFWLFIAPIFLAATVMIYALFAPLAYGLKALGKSRRRRRPIPAGKASRPTARVRPRPRTAEPEDAAPRQW